MSDALMVCAVVSSVWTLWAFRKSKGLWIGGVLVVLAVWTGYCFGLFHSCGLP